MSQRTAAARRYNGPQHGAHRANNMNGKSGWAAAREQQQQFKLDVLLTEAAMLFSHRGYAATSLDDIAARLNITKTALYYYVKNKNDLLYQCYLRSLEATEACYREADAQGSNGLEKVLAYLRLDAETGPIAMTPLIELDVIKDSEARTYLAERLANCEAQFRGFIELGIEDGSIAPCDAALTMQFVLGASRWTMKWYEPDGSQSLTDINDAFMRFVTDGLAPRER